MCLPERRRIRLETTAWSDAAGAVVLIAVAVERVVRSAALKAWQSRLYNAFSPQYASDWDGWIDADRIVHPKLFGRILRKPSGEANDGQNASGFWSFIVADEIHIAVRAYLLELTSRPITRTVRKAAADAITQMEISLPALSRSHRNQILTQAGLSLEQLLARA